MKTLSILDRKAAFLVATVLLPSFMHTVMAAKAPVVTTPVVAAQPTLPAACSVNAMNARAFPEMPASLKCTPAPEPYIIDANGNQTSIAPTIIKNKAAAIALGKLLFWDVQVGSDGLACASCHFQAGADNRVKNQINPGMRNASSEVASDGVTPIGDVFNFMASSYPGTSNILAAAAGKGANYTLKKADFPLRQYQEPEIPVEGQPMQADRNAPVIYDNDDVISSQGAYHATFNELKPSGKREVCQKRFPTSGSDMPIFNVTGYSVRQVEPRNTPTVINAVYNFRNFWDGRANNVFNGLDPFGLRRFADPAQTPKTEIYVKGAKNTLVKQRIAIYNASLASQAVGPALSDFEMSCGGKSFPELGKKMLSVKPLKFQMVDPTDSVLGSYAAKPGIGLKSAHTYESLIKSAFNNAYWDVPNKQKVDGYTLMQNNFSLFWGLAVEAYEATLVSDDSRFDQAQEDLTYGRDKLTEQEQHGLNVFFNQGKCIAYHLGSEFTAASVNHVTNPNNLSIGKYTERMLLGDGGIALYDSGFYNIGVRPSKEDLGVGATDAYGNPLSFTRNAKKNAPPVCDYYDPYAACNLPCDPYDLTVTCAPPANMASLSPDPFQANSFLFAAGTEPVIGDERDAIDGAFKVPSLRNVELTGPYFHNGGQATLEQVMQFYNRGGDRKDMFQKDPDCGGALVVDGMVAADPDTGLIDSSGFNPAPNGTGQASNLAADMAGAKELINTTCTPGQSPQETLRLTSADVEDLTAFLKTLTDERVRWEKAPFDHPSLAIPNGHTGDENKVTFNKATNQAKQDMIVLPAVGAAGRQAKGLPALQTFDSGLK
ncbi:MAG: cytochrome c peroxidase [Methylococcales bacterium]